MHPICTLSCTYVVNARIFIKVLMTQSCFSDVWLFTHLRNMAEKRNKYALSFPRHTHPQVSQMNRLLAMDLDKTLLMKDGSIPSEVVEKLKDLKTKGVHLAICTGRVRKSAEHYAKLIGGASVVSFNGSVIRTEDGEVRTSEIPLALMKDVLDFCYEKNVYVQFYRDDTIIVDRFTPELDTDLDVNFTSYEEVGDLRLLDYDPSPKMVALEMSDRVDGIIVEMNERFPELTVTNSSRYVMEIMPKGIDKGYGLRTVAENLGIGREDTVAIGDSMNDLAMLQWSGSSVAVHNADERLKEAADIVTENEMSYGVLEAIEKLF